MTTTDPKPNDVPPDTPPAPPPPPVRPEWLPEKFSTVEQMAEAYKELENKQSATPPAPETPLAPEPPADGTPPVIPKPPAPADDNYFDSFAKEYAESGKLSDDSIARLQKEKGLTPKQISTYLAGVQAETANVESAIYGVTGSAEKFTEMAQWAAQNMPEGRINEINSLLAAGGEQAVVGANALKSAFADAGGRVDSSLLDTTNPAGPDVSVYVSQQELENDMGSPQYRTDEAFRQRVADKLRRSDTLV